MRSLGGGVPRLGPHDACAARRFGGAVGEVGFPVTEVWGG